MTEDNRAGIRIYTMEKHRTDREHSGSVCMCGSGGKGGCSRYYTSKGESV